MYYTDIKDEQGKIARVPILIRAVGKDGRIDFITVDGSCAGTRCQLPLYDEIGKTVAAPYPFLTEMEKLQALSEKLDTLTAAVEGGLKIAI